MTILGGNTYERAGATTAGPDGYPHVGGGSTYHAKTGNTDTWGTASIGNNHCADVNGRVYSNTGSGWHQHIGGTIGESSWADRESQARSFGGARMNAAARITE